MREHHDKLSQTEIDRAFLSLAVEVSRRSDDPKAKKVVASGVGAIIANDKLAYVASANVIPPALKPSIELTNPTDERRYTHIEHAERSAIFVAMANGFDVSGATMYCTRFPCADCARAVVFSGVKRFVVPKGFSGETGWVGSQRAALEILRGAGVTVRYLSLQIGDI